MSESAKTCWLVGVAVVLAVVAFATRPHVSSGELEGQVGQYLFPEWKDASDAKTLEITSVDENNNALTTFKVADVNGRWVVPSHDDYPANAKEHVFKAASNIIGLKVLDVVSDAPGDQETYGVVEPNEKTLATSSFLGFGRLVAVHDANNKDLAQLIIGKEDKSPGDVAASNLRFVRKAGQDRIYRVALDTDSLTSKFQDWIDTDILALNHPWDVTDLKLRDYSLDQSITHRSDIDLAFDDAKATWSVKKLVEYKDNKPKETKLRPTEELDPTKLNDLKTNVSGLKLTDVQRKPASLAEKLKSGKSWMGDAPDSMARLGYLAIPKQNPTDLLSVGRDMTIGMKDGVEYTVHFGGEEVDPSKVGSSEKKSGNSAKDAKQDAFDRIVFVTARFNPDLIPKPALEPLPEVKKPAESKPPEKKAEPAKPAQAAPPKAGAKSPAPATNKSSQTDRHLSGELLALADTTEPKPTADAKQSTDTNSTKPAPAVNNKPASNKPAANPDSKAAPGKAAPIKASPIATKPAAQPAANDIQRAEQEEAREADRKRIETDNRRKQDEYDDAVKKGRAHAKELNTRFADWFYLISEDEFKKIHFGLDDITKSKPVAEAGPFGKNVQDPFAKQLPSSAHP